MIKELAKQTELPLNNYPLVQLAGLQVCLAAMLRSLQMAMRVIDNLQVRNVSLPAHVLWGFTQLNASIELVNNDIECLKGNGISNSDALVRQLNWSESGVRRHAN